MSDASMTTDERRARDFDEFARSDGYVFSKPTLAKFMRAIRASDEAAGMVLVPRKATERMAEAYLEEYLDNDASTPMECRIAALNAAIAAATEADHD